VAFPLIALNESFFMLCTESKVCGVADAANSQEQKKRRVESKNIALRQSHRATFAVSRTERTSCPERLS